MTSNKLLRLADCVGCSLSSACAVHCLAAPLLFSILPLSHVESIELPVIVVALSLAAASFSSGFVRNTSVVPLVLLVVAGPVMVASRCVHQPWLEALLLVTGSLLIAAGHLVNMRRSHSCASAAAVPREVEG